MKYLKYLIFLSICIGYSQSKIEKVEESLINESRKNTAISTIAENTSTNNSSSSGNFLTNIIGSLIIDAFMYTGYSVLIESPFEFGNKSHDAFLTKYPYYQANKGNYSFNWSDNSVLMRTTISSHYIFENSRINGNHLNIDLKFLKRMAIEANYLQLWEDNPNFGKQHLALYTLLAKYHRIRTETVDFWWGLGATYTDGNVGRWGFTYGLGLDLFILNPISFKSAFNQTFLNNNSINKLDFILNYHHKTLKFSGGYEHLSIGTENFSMMLLGAGISF